MECNSFGVCGSCRLYNIPYNEQIEYKKRYMQNELKEFFKKDIELFLSKVPFFRSRAEFRIFQEEDKLFYGMNGFDKKLVKIDDCKIVNKNIYNLMPILLKEISNREVLKNRLFAIEFMNSPSTNEMLITLIYHKKLEDSWIYEAKRLKERLNIDIIGRSRKEKIVLDRDYIYHIVDLNGKKFRFKYYEGSFFQPNLYMNNYMLSWVDNISKDLEGDLLELYCGAGNFSISLKDNFKNILATEVSKSSIKAAKENSILNNINNIKFVRMSAQEMAQALSGSREFKRLKEQNINLKDYNFTTILVDPPRSGVDKNSLEIMKKFDNIIYISCNLDTLKRDLKELLSTHNIKRVAMFDQFPYTYHIESGVYLVKNG